MDSGFCCTYRFFKRSCVSVGRRSSCAVARTPGSGRHPRGAGRHTAGIGRHPRGVGRHTAGIGRHTRGAGRHTAGIGRHTRVAGRHTPGDGIHSRAAVQQAAAAGRFPGSVERCKLDVYGGPGAVVQTNSLGGQIRGAGSGMLAICCELRSVQIWFLRTARR